ncbi:DUF1028 domain-containing protein [Jannaschia sp.]|nr:DUF1028 domain-containing protein [Jannaschia sp.]
MTWSLIARVGDEIGLIVASRFFACGAVVPWVGARSAVASQAFCNPIWGTEGRARLETGEAADTVLADLVSRDAGEAIRQAHMMDVEGRFAAHTGADCVDWCGHLLREDHSVAGNMLAGPQVLEATSQAFTRSDAPLPDRLITAMQAGEATGGDKRGRQAAGLVIHRGEAWPWLDLRADDDGDPLAELARLWDVAQERFTAFRTGMATAENFSGLTDRAPLDTAIAEAEARRSTPSRSRAVP